MTISLSTVNSHYWAHPRDHRFVIARVHNGDIFYSDAKWNYHGVILMQKRSYLVCTSTSNVVAIIKVHKMQNRWAYKPKMNAQNDCHFRLPMYEYFLGRAFHAIPGETGTYILTFYTCFFADWLRFICSFCSLVFVSLWNNNKR